MTGTTPFLNVGRLRKQFGTFHALNDVSLQVTRGEFICCLGPSGCGKSTLLRIIAGLSAPTQGVLEIEGRDVLHMTPAERDIGIVFQSYALFPNLTVADNVGYGLVNRRIAPREITRKVDALLNLVGLDGQGRKHPYQLSGGEQQRVALARALAISPSLLLLDEPLSALDAQVRVRLRSEIHGLQRHLGVTTIMVTHDQEEALAMADRVVVMNHGRIEQIGPPADIYKRPASVFVADFVGTMNFLDGRSTGGGTIEIGNIALTHETGQPASRNDAVRIGFRPEEVRIGHASRDGPNAIFVRVGSVEFLGAFCRVQLEPLRNHSATFVADLPAGLVEEFDIKEDRQIVVAIPSSSIRLFR